MERAESLAIAALWASVHNLRILVNRGLASPNEVDETYASVFEALEGSDPPFSELSEAGLQKAFAEMKAVALDRWIGKGEANPR